MKLCRACENTKCKHHSVFIPCRDMPYFEICLDNSEGAMAFNKAVIERKRFIWLLNNTMVSEAYLCNDCFLSAKEKLMPEQQRHGAEGDR